MRVTAFALMSVVGLAASGALANAAPPVPAAPAAPASASVLQVSAGCGYGFHRDRGSCIRDHRYYHPYAHRPHAYRYGGGYQPLNRPSPSDHVADQLNAQGVERGY